METISAKVIEEDGAHFIEISTDEAIKIPLSEDKPNLVKSAFNQLIEHIKEGDFEIKLEDVGEDLFSQVAQEYTSQLNREIQEVREEMIDYGLIEVEEDDFFSP